MSVQSEFLKDIAMIIVQGLRGRGSKQRAFWSRLDLLWLLVFVPIGLRALEFGVSHVNHAITRDIPFGPVDRWIFSFERIIACAGYLVAGIVLDRFGLKRGFALVILAWCALVTVGATFMDPVAYRVLSPAISAMLPGFVLTSLLLATRLAWPARRRGFVVAALLGIYFSVAAHGVGLWTLPQPNADFPSSWRVPMLALATVGTVLVAVWVFCLKEVEESTRLDLRPAPQTPDAWIRIFLDPRVWAILAIQFCLSVVWYCSRRVTWDFEPLGAGAAMGWAIAFGTQIAFVLAAWLSDRRYRLLRGWAEARWPFIIAGLGLAAIAPLFALLTAQSGPALKLVDLVALGITQVADLLVLDLAPRRFAGRFIGFTLAGEAAAATYLRPLFEPISKSPSGNVLLIVVFALLPAGIAARTLPRLRPADP